MGQQKVSIKSKAASSYGAVFIILTFILVLTFSSILRQQVSANNVDWMNDTLQVIQSSTSVNTSTANFTSQDCSTITVKTQKYKYVNSVLVSDGTGSRDICMLQTQLGMVGTNTVSYVQLPGSEYAQRLRYANTDVIAEPVPNSRTTILHYGSDTRIAYNLTAIGTSTAVSPERQFVLNSLPSKLVDENNATLAVSNIAFSRNGEWMVAVAKNVQIRMHLPTQAIQTFAQKGTGTGISYQFAISNDGRYVYSQRIQSSTGSPYIYDLSGCAANQSFTISTAVASGCVRRDIKPLLQASLSTFTRLNGARISYDGNKLSGIANYGTNLHKYVDIVHTNYTQPQVEYLALGDSFASGEGDTEGGTWYVTGTDESNNKCHVSRRSYPYLTAQQLGFHNALNTTPGDNALFHSVACSSAKTDHLTTTQYNVSNAGTWLPGASPQIEHVNRVKPTSLTISVGGNDATLVSKLRSCIQGAGSCYSSYEDRLEVLNEIKGKFSTLTETYKKLKEASPATRIYVMGYPQIFATSGNCAANVLLDQNEREFASGAIKYMNDTVEAAADYAGVYYVDAEDALSGKKLCEDASHKLGVNGLTKGNDVLLFIGNESFHPNPVGHSAMNAKLMQLTNGLTAAMPTADPSAAAPSPTNSAYADFLDVTAENRTIRALVSANNLAQNKIVKGVQSVVSGSYLKPLTQYEVWLHSTPTQLATVTTDSDGNFTTNVTLSSNIDAGLHTLHIFGPDHSGQTIDVNQQVLVAEEADDQDGDNVLDENEVCGLVTESGNDVDEDQVDDACDAVISSAPIPSNLYRARNGDPNNGEPADRIYIERNVANADDLLDLTSSDDDPNNDGWSIVGQTDSATDGIVANFWIEDTAPSTPKASVSDPASEQRYVPNVTLRHPTKGCLQLSPTSLSVVAANQSRGVDEVAENTANCRSEQPHEDTDNDSTADNLEVLYRARNGDTNKGESVDKVYIERNIVASEAILGISDYDHDNDGWSIVAISSNTDHEGVFANDYLYYSSASALISQTRLMSLSSSDQKTVVPLASLQHSLNGCTGIRPLSSLALSAPVKQGESRGTEALQTLLSGVDCS